MAGYVNNPLIVLERVVGSQETIEAQLIDQHGDAVNLTGLSIVFRLIDTSDDSVKVNNASATIDDAATGKVSYAPASADVDSAGKYAIYFIDTTSTPNRRWPYDGARWILRLKTEGTP